MCALRGESASSRTKGGPARRRDCAKIRERDHRDITRADSPLMRAPDAILVDTTALSLDEVERVIWKSSTSSGRMSAEACVEDITQAVLRSARTPACRVETLSRRQSAGPAGWSPSHPLRITVDLNASLH